MKEPAEYLKDVDWADKWFWDIEDEVEVIIKQAQIDAYNEAIKDVINNVKLTCQLNPHKKGYPYAMINPNGTTENSDKWIVVDKESILKLKLDDKED